MSHYSGRVIESQVDWLTVSAHGEDRAQTLEDYGHHLQKEAIADGNDLTPWRSMGYVGTHAGHIDVGRRDSHSVILRVTGAPADGCLSTALSAADNVTRLDVAVTWRAEPPDPYLGANAYSNAFIHWKAHPAMAEPSAHMDASGGYTCYLGDRRSPYYARVYNKQAERESRKDAKLAAHYAGCWRYEVEAHDLRAMALAEMVSGREERQAAIQQWLYEWFTKRGIPPAFPESGADALVPGFHRRTDDETRLRHLARNVAPTIRKLRAHGHDAKVRDVLGFDQGEQLLRQLKALRDLPWPTMGGSDRENGPREGGSHA